jgi:hypothetical protein
MIQRFLTLLLLLCSTAEISDAYVYVDAYLQRDSIDANGKRSAFVLVTYWEHITQKDGTELDVLRSRANVCVSGYPAPQQFLDCAVMTLGNSVFYTEKSSPNCVAAWLHQPGMDSLATAAVKLALSQKHSTEDRIRITPGTGYIAIEANSKARDLDGAIFDVYDSAGNLLELHKELQGNVESQWYTISTSRIPPGPYKATLRKKNGETMETLFVLR